jgi:hypothetical protein
VPAHKRRDASYRSITSKKLRYIGVEMFVKRCAVEARQAIADFLHLSGQADTAAGRKL